MYPYGDARTQQLPPPVYDDGDERAAVWTARAFYAAVFVAVICVAVFVSLWTIRDDTPAASTAPPPACRRGWSTG